MKPAPRPQAEAPTPQALLVIDRLAEAVERETQELHGPGPVDFRAHSQRKSQGLMELGRVEATFASARQHPRFRASLMNLLAKLDANERLLQAKLRAARTVAELVARAISDGQSDGTYSDQIWRENRP